jgi:hypothetical protein
VVYADPLRGPVVFRKEEEEEKEEERGERREGTLRGEREREREREDRMTGLEPMTFCMASGSWFWPRAVAVAHG